MPRSTSPVSMACWRLSTGRRFWNLPSRRSLADTRSEVPPNSRLSPWAVRLPEIPIFQGCRRFREVLDGMADSSGHGFAPVAQLWSPKVIGENSVRDPATSSYKHDRTGKGQYRDVPTLEDYALDRTL